VPKNRKVNTLDGYATIRAVARTKSAPAPASSADAPTDVPAPESQKPGARVASTTLPVKHRIECYECGYRFQTHGRATSSHCPKCRALLDLTDHTIDAEWSETIKTAGAIRLTPTGVLKAGDLVGADVIVEGIIEGGRVRALHTLELGPGAIFSEKSISAPDLRIAAGATFAFKQDARYRNVEVWGKLNANLDATGVVTVKPGGLLRGRVQAQHLVVEDGGGLQAALHIAPQPETPPDRDPA
jgi:cytoskeletal protein CcmA (bactofilin family)